VSITKERIMGAVSLMSEKDAELLWTLIQSKYVISQKTWNDIETVEPDEFDLIMLNEIENNPECHEFLSSDELIKELGL